MKGGDAVADIDAHCEAGDRAAVGDAARECVDPETEMPEPADPNSVIVPPLVIPPVNVATPDTTMPALVKPAPETMMVP